MCPIGVFVINPTIRLLDTAKHVRVVLIADLEFTQNAQDILPRQLFDFLVSFLLPFLAFSCLVLVDLTTLRVKSEHVFLTDLRKVNNKIKKVEKFLFLPNFSGETEENCQLK
jgi:hypothetical protein